MFDDIYEGELEQADFERQMEDAEDGLTDDNELEAK